MQTDVLIVGGGLSGLHTAYELNNLGIDFKLLEARNRLGGRILSHNLNNTSYNSALAAIDLGPSWFWPSQVRIKNLLHKLKLTDKVFSQASTGDTLYENAQGSVQRGLSGFSMAGSYRLQGGIQQLVTALSSYIPNNALLQDSSVTLIRNENSKLSTSFLNSQYQGEISSKYIVLALPPRVAANTIEFAPAFTQTRIEQLNAVATWMAAHAKFVSVYDQPFWHEQGLSGDVISHLGPLQEIHDASSQNGELHALFGFVSVPARYRKEREEEIRTLAIAQLTRLFGESASKPIEVHMKDWAKDPFTSTELDQEQLTHHPANDIVSITEESWDKKLIWSGTESVDYRQHNNGLLEGALEASTNTVALLKTLIK